MPTVNLREWEYQIHSLTNADSNESPISPKRLFGFVKSKQNHVSIQVASERQHRDPRQRWFLEEVDPNEEGRGELLASDTLVSP